MWRQRHGVWNEFTDVSEEHSNANVEVYAKDSFETWVNLDQPTSSHITEHILCLKTLSSVFNGNPVG
jgi:hypothetical protein